MKDNEKTLLQADVVEISHSEDLHEEVSTHQEAKTQSSEGMNQTCMSYTFVL